MPKTGKRARQTALFDIRVKSADHNVIVLKGPEHDASSALLSGVIVLSVLEPIAIKKLTLKLYATLRLNWTEHFQGVKGPVARPMKYEKRIYEYNWDPLNIADYCRSLHGGDGHGAADLPGLSSGRETLNRSNNSSSSSLKSLQKQSKSSVNLSHSFASLANLAHAASADKADAGTNHVLVQGNYEFPFSTIVPGSIPESVEGLPGCSLVYKLQSTIERGRFSQPLVTKKHIRVVRTTTSDAVELSETIAVDNTWPKKVDYSISAPNRAVAIGSSTRVDMLLVPLLKGLRLGNVKLSLVEYYTYCGHVGGHTDERTVVVKNIKKPKSPDGSDIWADMDVGLDGNFYNDGEIELSPDKWNITTYLQLPPSLNLCTQDCDILSNVKVRHKLKFVIGLVNPDGHVSELRATLPIILFISPFVAVTARKVEPQLDEAHNYNVEDVSVERDGAADEDVLFSTDMDGAVGTAAGATGAAGNGTGSSAAMAHVTSTDTQDLLAPPNYENRVYDRLWSDVASPVDSPVASGFATPRADVSTPFGSAPQFSTVQFAQAQGAGGNAGGNAGVSAAAPGNAPGNAAGNYTLNNSQLVENLRLLHLQREMNHQSMDDLTLSSAPVTPAAAASSAPNGPGPVVAGGAPSSGSSAARRKPKFTLMSEDADDQDYFSFKAQPQAQAAQRNVGPAMTTGTLAAQTPGVGNLGALMSPGAMSPVQHLSRSNSQTELDALNGAGSQTQSPPAGGWDDTVMSRVPSYSTAMKANAPNEFAPVYEPPLPGSSIDLHVLNKRLLQQQQQSEDESADARPATAHGGSKAGSRSHMRRSNFSSDSNPLTFDLARSRGSSSNSSPAISRNQSASNLFGFNTSNSNSSTKIAKHFNAGSSSALPQQQQQQTQQQSQQPSQQQPSPVRPDTSAGSSHSAFSLSPMTPIQKVSTPPQAHLNSSKPAGLPKTAALNAAAESSKPPSHSPSFLNMSKKSHSSMSLNFLHKKR